MGANIPPPPEKPKEPEPTEEAKTPEKEEPMTEPEPKEVTPNLSLLKEWEKILGITIFTRTSVTFGTKKLASAAPELKTKGAYMYIYVCKILVGNFLNKIIVNCVCRGK